MEEWPNIIWNICNFYSVKSIECPEIAFRHIKCYLILEQNTFKDISQDCFTLHLKCFECNREIKFSVSTFIKDRFGELHFVQHKNITVEFRRTLRSVEMSWEIWKVGRKGILDMSEDLLSDPVSLVVCFGPISTIIKNSIEASHHMNKKEDKMVQTSFPIDNSSCVEALCRDFCNLLDSHLEPDTTIKCEDCAFPVHKAILSSRSEVFAAMFRSDMLEKRNGSVTITDLDPSILKQLLHYIYTGTLTNLTDDTALLLYSAAHKYTIAALQRRCVQFMVQNLSESSACDCLLLADACNDTELKNSVISYIIDNKAILSSKTWMRLCADQMQLSNEVYCEYFRKS